MLDAYFEHNTGNAIEFQKSFGASGDNPNWLTKGSRWRPKSLSK
jgi:ABC-type sulfate transport system substrate-binding protein